MAAEAYYLVVLQDDGGVVTYTELPETMPEVVRQATTADVYSTSRQIVEEFDRGMLSNKILSDLLQALNPPQKTQQDVIKEALKKRENFSAESSESVN